MRLDPSQIAGLGPSIDALLAMLLERKRKILAKFETKSVQNQARKEYQQAGQKIDPPAELKKPFERAVREEQLRDLETLWYAADDERSRFARQLVSLVETLGQKYQVDELAAKYAFTGRTPLTIAEALAVKEELEKIDELLKQLEEAEKNAQIGMIDLELLEQFAEPGDMEKLGRAAADGRELRPRNGRAARAGAATAGGFRLTPQGLSRCSKGGCWSGSSAACKPRARGRHQGPVVGEGAVETASDEGIRIRRFAGPHGHSRSR